MPWREVLDLYDLLDDASASGESVAAWLRKQGVDDVSVTTVQGDKGSTDFVRAVIPGSRGRLAGGDVPTLGVIGRLGGLGARPERIGFVSDGDGALVALAVAGKLGSMARRGDQLPGDVIVATHVCPDAPTRPHDPVPFMDSPVDVGAMNEHEVEAAMEAVLSVDTTKGNRIVNHHGFAISPTVKEGWILRVSEDLLEIASQVTGRLPAVLPLTMQDITPYGNDVYHVNSILQPCTATAAPVVGVAITTETAVPGCGTGATDLASAESAARFCVEAAKSYGAGTCELFDPADFDRLTSRYGSMRRLQTMGA
ncbi:DUF1177 domain-containing protein [Kribbella solani]|uniref:DUF1177 domain-containing protein n=1 Tax=Kribbella solani TaxID=236067 RepID=A0A841DJ75_9ACTN|nr:DUF1177 domain-containing protein [Kribbella solani]MBB5976750.1 hypothetical protein [Kribbella solani]MDX2970827.1 DUF1177 domain-containing protein [Kribbella solani]MDX3006350.1 DUF1177 domain-containing protein [Kribbella solani]